MSKPNKINIILIIVCVLLGLALLGVVAWRVINERGTYHAVFLTTGDLYFGKLTRFPTFGMKNVYFVQATGDQTNPLSIQKFTNVFWGPEDVMQINKKEVVWMTKIDKESGLAKLLKENPNLENQGAPEQTLPQANEIPEATPPATE